MANKYAGSDLYNIGVRQPTEMGELYRLYGITDHTTTAHNTWYYLDSTHWQSDTPDIATDYNDGLYENGKFFMKDHFASSARTSSWLTIQEHAQLTFSSGDNKHPRLSPVNTKSERQIYSLVTGEEVIAIQYSDPVSEQMLYYIHPNYIQEANLGWHTAAELLHLGYSFDHRSISCIYNIGSSTTSHTSIGVVQY